MSDHVDAIDQATVDRYLDIGLSNADSPSLGMTLEELTEDLCMYCDFFEDVDEAAIMPFVKDWLERHKEQLLAAVGKRKYGEPID